MPLRTYPCPQLPGRVLHLEKGTLHIGPTLGAGVQGKVKRAVFAETGEVCGAALLGYWVVAWARCHAHTPLRWSRSLFVSRAAASCAKAHGMGMRAASNPRPA